MSDPSQGMQTRPAGTQPLTPDQIAAQVSGNGQHTPTGQRQQYQAPAPQYQQPQYQAPQYQPPAMPQQDHTFNVGTYPQGTSQELLYENTRLKKQMSQNAVYSAAGGQDKFQAMANWARTGRTPEANAQLNDALNNPNVPDSLRSLAVQAAMREFEAASQNDPGTALLMGDAGIRPGHQHGVVPQTNPIEKGEYHARYVALRKAGKDMYSPEMRELDKERMSGIRSQRSQGRR